MIANLKAIIPRVSEQLDIKNAEIFSLRAAEARNLARIEELVAEVAELPGLASMIEELGAKFDTPTDTAEARSVAAE